MTTLQRNRPKTVFFSGRIGGREGRIVLEMCITASSIEESLERCVCRARGGWRGREEVRTFPLAAPLLLLLYIESEGLSVPESRASAFGRTNGEGERSHFRDKRGKRTESSDVVLTRIPFLSFLLVGPYFCMLSRRDIFTFKFM